MKRSSHASHGFSLVEVTLALGVTAVALITIFGLLVTGTQTNHTAVEQTYSSDILTAVAADLRATPKTSPPGAATPRHNTKSTYRRIQSLPRRLQRFISAPKGSAHPA